MSNSIMSFAFEAQTVRTAINHQDNSIWFCLKDVADILGISNAKQSRFSLDEAGVHKMYVSYESGKKQVTFINEPNLYRVIFRSNKAEAVKFQNWVFDEVLPQIRKTGSYHISQPAQPKPAPQSAKLSQSDYNKLKIAIYSISTGFKMEGGAKSAIYARLRQICQVDSIHDIRYDQLNLVKNEMSRIERIFRSYNNFRLTAEKILVRRVCMGDDNAVWEAIQHLEQISHDYAERASRDTNLLLDINMTDTLEVSRG